MPSDSIKILESMMDIASFRHRLLASNIANVDTPGYKARDIAFQREMNRAIQEIKGQETRIGEQRFRVFEPAATMPSIDGNTVNIEMEMAKVAENALTYNAAVSLMTMQIRMMKAVLRPR